MRIVYVTFDDLTSDYAWAVHAKQVINGLVRRGHEVRVLAGGPRGPADLAGEYVPMSSQRSRAGRTFYQFIRSLQEITKVGSSLGADLIYCRGIHLTPTPWLAARLLGCPFVVEVNGLLEAEVGPSLKGPVRLIHRLSVAAAQRIITVSDRLRTGLCRLYGANADKIHVISNGADPDRFRPAKSSDARKRLGLAERKTIVYVGSFYPHHALDLLPEVARNLPDGQFLLVGDGVSRAELEKEMPKDRTTFTGSVAHDHVPEYVAAGDIGLYMVRRPHPDFGFSPLKLFEYMAAGRPVLVGTDLPEIQKFVLQHDIGEAVGLDVEGLVASAKRLLNNPDPGMGERGRELILQEYSWDKAVDRVEEVMRSCVSP